MKTNPQKPSYVGSYYDSTYLDGVQGIALDVRHFFLNFLLDLADIDSTQSRSEAISMSPLLFATA